MDGDLYKKALNLENFTLIYNVLEVFFSIFFSANAKYSLGRFWSG